jgi:hypothetical protein
MDLEADIDVEMLALELKVERRHDKHISPGHPFLLVKHATMANK